MGSEAWQWVDGSAMRMGMPSWYLWDSDLQEPSDTSKDCALMLLDHGYYYFAADCAASYSAICELID